ncbi:uncharacterized protein LOC130770588 isoform X1 [Actinidia eriantha]|uniref:uncharacterized protein LOC130770588 isoform X1 n=1 Tax=Actinidia eriantha TaxID=165200 RepID=UPI00258CC5D3|nr:uncharacterized protein LOC130770588 isoform X1 [Actinidia eriantha]
MRREKEEERGLLLLVPLIAAETQLGRTRIPLTTDQPSNHTRLFALVFPLQLQEKKNPRNSIGPANFTLYLPRSLGYPIPKLFTTGMACYPRWLALADEKESVHDATLWACPR